MDFGNLLTLLGGLALFLFAITEMNRNMTAIAGRKMKSLLQRLTKGPLRGYLTGFGITLLNQSSSATTVLEAAMVGAGFMTFHQSLTVTLGAELGSTIFPQLVAFPSLKLLYPVFIGAGFVTTMVSSRMRYRHIGLTFIMFGLLFLGLGLMSDALKPLHSHLPFLRLMENIEKPVLGILLGLVFTMIIQSSGATAGITMAMSAAGTITLEQAVLINMGAAVGTCITAVLGSLTLNREAKRAAFIHIMFQTLGVIWVLILLSFTFREERFYIWWIKWFTLNILRTDSMQRQIAMGFTFMPIINHILLFPNLKFAVMIFNRMFPERDVPQTFGVTYLDDSLLGKSAGLSLIMAKKEILRGAEVIKEMIEEMMKSFHSSDPESVERIKLLDSKVDLLHKSVIPFLASLSREDLSAKQSKTCLSYIRIQNELESIGDVIDKNIMSLVAKKIEQNLIFSQEGFRELEHLLYQIGRNFHILAVGLESENPRDIREVLDYHRKREEEKYKQLHIERLRKGLPESIATSAVHLDLITYFSRINSQIAYIARQLSA